MTHPRAIVGVFESGATVYEGDRCANTGSGTWRRIEVPVSDERPCLWVGKMVRDRRPLTLDEALRGDLPKPMSADEWRAMALASAGKA